MSEKINERVLLTLKEFCEYLGVGMTKAREMIKEPRNGFAIKIGSKWFVHNCMIYFATWKNHIFGGMVACIL